MAVLTDEELIASVRRYTKTGPVRCQAMISALRRIDSEGIEGAVVECGVWRGGNIILARAVSPDRVCWLYDTFTGMTEPGLLDINKRGGEAKVSYDKKIDRGERWAAASVDEVKQYFRDVGVFDETKLRFVVGDVEDTLRRELPGRIALVRCDTDWYASTKLEIEVLYPLLAPGGILIVDDYGHWMGARKAVDEYFGTNGPPMERIDYTAIQMVKPC